MATNLHDETQCAKCSSLIKTTSRSDQSLPCGHVCCNECIGTKDDRSDSFACPVCESNVCDQDDTAMVTINVINNAKKRESCAPVELSELLPTEKVCELFNECPQHISEHMLFYCLTCDGPICQRCLVPDHLNHDVEEQDEIIKRQNEEIGEKIEAMDQELKHCEESLEQVNRKESEMRQSVDDEHKKIAECCDALVTKLRLEGKQLMEELKAFDSQHTFLDQIGKNREDLQKKLETVESISTSFKQQDDEGLLQCYKTMITQLDDLLTDDDAIGLNVSTPTVPRFISAPMPTTMPCIGDIVVTEPFIPEDEEEDTYETIWDGHARANRQSEAKQQVPKTNAPSVPPTTRAKTKNTRHSYEWTIIGNADGSDASQEASLDPNRIAPEQEVKPPTPRMIENPGYLQVKPRQKNFHYLQLVSTVGRFSDASSVATGGAGTIAVCDRHSLQTSIFRKDGIKYREITSLKSLQPRGVAVLYDGTVVVANVINAEMFSPNHIYEVIPEFRSKSVKRSKQISLQHGSKAVASEVNEALKRNTISECDPPTPAIGQDDYHYRKTIVHTTKDDVTPIEASNEGKPKSSKVIESVANFSGNNFLLGDIARNVITRHTSSGLLFETIDVEIKPYVITAIDHQRIIVSDHDNILIKYTSGASKLLHITNVFGLCYLSRVGAGSLLVTTKKKGSFRGYKKDKGAIDNYDISDANKTMIGRPLNGLYKPGALVLLSEDELAVADKKSVKIYRFV